LAETHILAEKTPKTRREAKMGQPRREKPLKLAERQKWDSPGEKKPRLPAGSEWNTLKLQD